MFASRVHQRDVLEEDAEFLLQEFTKENSVPDNSFVCEFWDKIYKTKRSLSMHKNAMHSQPDTEGNSSCSKKHKTAEEICHPLHFKKHVELSVEKTAADLCYPENFREEIKAYGVKITVENLELINHTYSFIRECITSFSGDADVKHNKYLILGAEVANHLLAFLSGARIEANIDDNCRNISLIQLNEKEEQIVAYFGGYVFGTFYR